MIDILTLGICQSVKSQSMADHNGSQIIQHTVLVSTFGNKKLKKEIPVAVVESMSKTWILASDTKLWLPYALSSSSSTTKKETLTVGSIPAVALKETIQLTTKMSELETKKISRMSVSKLELIIELSRKSQLCHKLMMMTMKVPMNTTLSPQITNHHQKKLMPKEKSDRREKNGPIKLMIWPINPRVCTCSINSLCSSPVCVCSLPSFVYALLFIKLSKSAKDQRAMKELSLSTKKVVKRNQDLPTQQVSCNEDSKYSIWRRKAAEKI